MRRLPIAVAGVLGAWLAATPLAAQKVDTVVIRNGDRIVGEIKSLDHGALTYKTDDVGTLTIKWDKVHRIVSPRYFEVEDERGRRYYGALQSAGVNQRMVVAVTSFIDTLDILRVVRIYPIGLGFWARVDGRLNLNVTFQRANKLRSVGLDLDAQHRTRLRLTELQSSTYFQAQEGAAQTSRNSLALSELRFLQARWLLTAAGQLEQNKELDLALRALVGAGGGRFLVQTNRVEVRTLAGLAFTNERFEGSSAASNLEMLITGEGTYFKRDYPKTDIQTTVTLYPNLTDLGRIRADLDASLTHEFIRDFNTGFTVFYRFDSRPKSATAAKHDYGVALTIGWTF
ncbi:MAG TPA: DUF481 domain-containing protein [Gemmatimonadales bacterium]|nr:DUF481 domain-containing protein [Gemmatimonadales bacterium]